MDPYQKATEGRGLLEKIAGYIPIFGGYLERDRRRESDKIVRDFAVRKIEEAKKSLDGLILRLTDSGQLFALKGMDRIQNRLQKLASKIRYAEYGESGFFDTVKVREADLEELYRFDMALVKAVDELAARIAKIEAVAGDAAARSEAIASFTAEIDDLEKGFDGRKDAILGLA